MDWTRDKLEHIWLKATDLDPASPLHAAIITECIESMEDEDDFTAGMRNLIRDLQLFIEGMESAEQGEEED